MTLGRQARRVFDEAGKRIGAPIWHDTKPQPSRIDTALVLLAVILSRPNFNSADDDRLVMNTATFAARLAANQALVHFDRMLVTNGVALGPNHSGSEFVENLKCRLIARERKLALELDGGLSRDLRRHEIRAPKPRREGRVARLHDSASRQRRIGFAATAAQHDRRAGCEPVGLAHNAALRARKSARPTNGFKIAGASRVVGEYPLKLRKRSWEAANVHGCDNGRFLSLCQATG